MMSAFLTRRVYARLLLGFLSSMVCVVLFTLFESIYNRHLRQREFLFEPVLPASAASKAPAQVLDNFRFAIDLPANELRPGLKPNQFLIGGKGNLNYRVVRLQYERKVQTSRTQIQPLSLGLLFDQSGSIGGPTSPGTDAGGERIRAGKMFIDMLPDTARAAVFAFGEPGEPEPGQLKADFGSDRTTVKQVIDALYGHEGGGTPTYVALKNVIARMGLEPADRARKLICFTDGPPDQDNTALAPDVVAEARKNGVNILFVALGPPNTDWSTNEQIARETGGSLVRVEHSNSLAQVFKQLASGLVKLDRSQYHLVVEAQKAGDLFQNGESLQPLVSAPGARPQQYTISISRPNVGGH